MIALIEARKQLKVLVTESLYDAAMYDERYVAYTDDIMEAADAYVRAAVAAHIRQEDTAAGQRP